MVHMARGLGSDSQELAVLERIGQSVVITMTVPILSGEDTARSLRTLLIAARRRGAGNFILDLQNVTAMDSVCVAVLVEVLTEMQQSEAGGRIALVNTDPNVQYLFRITRLDRVFPICRDVMAALGAVEGM